MLAAVKPGNRLLIDDGRLELCAEVCYGHSIQCCVVAGTFQLAASVAYIVSGTVLHIFHSVFRYFSNSFIYS